MNKYAPVMLMREILASKGAVMSSSEVGYSGSLAYGFGSFNDVLVDLDSPDR